MKKRDFLKGGLFTMGALLLPRKIWAMDFYPTTSKAEWAVLYGTWCGSSRDAAAWISEGMDGIAKVFDVRENPDLSGYKYVIVGGSIRAGKTTPELQRYLTEHNEQLKGKIKGLFAVCGNMKQPVTQVQYKQLIDNYFAKLTGVNNVASKVFLGRITWGLMEPDARKQLQAFNLDEYDNLKRSECMAFGKEVLRSVAP
jgi:menaquinone-dependent protoporphyrinogen IX oxidase